MTDTPPKVYTEDDLRTLSREDLERHALLWQSVAAKPKRGHAVDHQKRPKRPFDMTKYTQRMIALRIAYHGWRFNGFAQQPNLDNTIEDNLFAALLKTRLIESRDTADYSRAGRTDKGVSALANVVGLRVRSKRRPDDPAISDNDELDYVHILNSVLPDGLRISAWAPAPDRTGLDGGRPFSARFDATFRAYKYFFPRGTLDIHAMRTAASSFVGRHDFRNFCKVDANAVQDHFHRLMYAVDVAPAAAPPASFALPQPADPDPATPTTMFELRVTGQAFMWHQVRCMAAVLFAVGRGAEAPDIVRRMLDPASPEFGTHTGKPIYRMAPDTPLVLCECAYPDGLLDFRCSARAAARLDAETMAEWVRVSCSAAVVREQLGSDAGVRVEPGDLSPRPPSVESAAGWAEEGEPLEKRPREKSIADKVSAMAARKRSKLQ